MFFCVSIFVAVFCVLIFVGVFCVLIFVGVLPGPRSSMESPGCKKESVCVPASR